MKMILGVLLAVAVLFNVPSAQAQWGGHLSGHSNGGQRSRNQHRRRSRGSSVRGHLSGHSRGNYNANHIRLREDHERNFGRDHIHHGSDFRWRGPEYVIGSCFFIGGFWFQIDGPWFVTGNPYAFDYYVVWDENANVYFVYSDAFPGSRVAVSVMF